MKKLLLATAALTFVSACGSDSGASGASETNTVLLEAARFDAPVPAKGDPSKASDALAGLFLNKSGEGRVNFNDKELSGAKATFKDVAFQLDDFNRAGPLDALSEDSETESNVEINIDVDSSPITAAELTFEGLNVNETGQATFGAMIMTDITASSEEDGEDTDMKIGSVKLINPTPEMAAWVSAVFGKGEPADFPTPDKLGFDQLIMSGLTLNVASEDEDVVMSIDTFEINEWKDLLAGRFLLEGLNLNVDAADAGESAKINIGKIALDGMQLDFISAFAEHMDDEEKLAEALISKAYGNPIDPGLDRMEVSDVMIDAAGIKIEAPKWLFGVKRNKDGIPTVMNLDTFSLKFSADPEGGDGGAQVAPVLMMMGFEEVNMTAAGVTKYDPETDIATTESSYFEIADALKVSNTGKIGGYKAYGEALSQLDFEELAADPEDIMGSGLMDAYAALSVYNFDLTLEDKGLTEKILTIASAQTGQSPDALRQQAVFGLTMGSAMASGSGVDPEIVQDAVAALTKFISEPGTLKLSLNPDAPLTVEDFKDPTKITKERLGFVAEAQ